MTNISMVQKDLNNSIFIDTDVLIAIQNELDPLSTRAKKIIDLLQNSNSRFITGTNVIAEVATIISQRFNHLQAVDFLETIRNGDIEIIHPDQKLIFEAEKIFIKQTSKNVSYADCISFAIMINREVDTAFTFDSDFKKNGFVLLEDVFKN